MNCGSNSHQFAHSEWKYNEIFGLAKVRPPHLLYNTARLRFSRGRLGRSPSLGKMDNSFIKKRNYRSRNRVLFYENVCYLKHNRKWATMLFWLLNLLRATLPHHVDCDANSRLPQAMEMTIKPTSNPFASCNQNNTWLPICGANHCHQCSMWLWAPLVISTTLLLPWWPFGACFASGL